ncbi:hypothetical protein C8R47DRAFT_1076704 [Mycena vitilis]|nr:hypothetical protein C8R47DRAFT_1076704 [Mycena vitilis]
MRVLTTIVYLTAAASTLAINVPPEIAGRGKTIFHTGASLTISFVEAPPPPTSAIVSAYSQEVRALQDALAEYNLNNSNNFDVHVTLQRPRLSQFLGLEYGGAGWTCRVRPSTSTSFKRRTNGQQMEDVSKSTTPPAPSSSSMSSSQATTSASISTSTQPLFVPVDDHVPITVVTGRAVLVLSSNSLLPILPSPVPGAVASPSRIKHQRP